MKCVTLLRNTKGKQFGLRADDKLKAFSELELAILAAITAKIAET